MELDFTIGDYNKEGGIKEEKMIEKFLDLAKVAPKSKVVISMEIITDDNQPCGKKEEDK